MNVTQVIGLIGGSIGILGVGGIFGLMKIYREAIKRETLQTSSLEAAHQRMDNMNTTHTYVHTKLDIEIEKLKAAQIAQAEWYGVVNTELTNIKEGQKEIKELVQKILEHK